MWVEVFDVIGECGCVECEYEIVFVELCDDFFVNCG